MVGLKLKLFATSIAGGFYKVVVQNTTTLSLDKKEKPSRKRGLSLGFGLYKPTDNGNKRIVVVEHLQNERLIEEIDHALRGNDGQYGKN